MLKARMEVTGAKFVRLLRAHNITLSMFAVNTKISFEDLSQLKMSQAIVPKIYLYKLQEQFDITEQDIVKYNKAA